ncbi:MAG: tail fiber domain-containing protein [Dehalococcoidia bacterium]
MTGTTRILHNNTRYFSIQNTDINASSGVVFGVDAGSNAICMGSGDIGGGACCADVLVSGYKLARLFAGQIQQAPTQYTQISSYSDTSVNLNQLCVRCGTSTTYINQYSTCIKVSGTTGFPGIEYCSNYSSNYTDRSLVDKEWVLSQVGGGGLTWSGTTANGIGTYIDANKICSQANLTFNGTSLDLAGNLVFRTGAARIICLPAASGLGNTICVVGQDNTGNSTAAGGAIIIRSGCGGAYNSSTQSGAGGALNLCSGIGGINTDGAQGGSGGAALFCGGVGGNATSNINQNGGAGGDVVIAGGAGGSGYPITAGIGGTGGDVCIKGGQAGSGTVIGTPGEVYIYRNGTTLVLNTISSPGICITGALCVSSSITSAAAIASINYTCSTGYLLAGTYVCSGSYTRAATYVCAVACLAAGTCVCAGTCGVAPDWIATSDVRLKKDIEPITDALSIVTQLQGVSYHLCGDEKCELNIGLIAQEVMKVLPEVVSHTIPAEEDAKYGIIDDKLGLKYDKLTAVLIEAVKEQQQQINRLELELSDLKGNMSLIRNR